jgi:penicillin-binding protein 1A
VHRSLPNVAKILEENKTPVVTIKDTNGIVLAKYGDIHGVSLSYKKLPKHLIQAVISIEDRRFFNHPGIDILGLIRAFYVNHRAGKLVQGGSTLTQQLAKITLLTPDRTIFRKLQDIILAIEIENKFSKEEIITMYLNRVYLGRGNYGVDAASKFYFGKNIGDINLTEAAMLAGMLKSPNRLAPSNNEEAALKRAKQVLYSMEHEGYISINDLHNIPNPRIIKRGDGRGALHDPYFTDYVMDILPDLVGPIERSMTVLTTLDFNMQNKLEQSLIKIMHEQGTAKNAHQAAAISIDNEGAIKAWVGGTAYRDSQFDRVYQAKRQPGSAFKLFVYLAALENGIKPGDKYIDHPISVDRWRPRNFSRDFKGSMSVADAFINSINTITVQLCEKVGRQKVANIARSLGIKEEMQLLPSMALGANETTLIQMSGAYATISAEGHAVTPVAITKVLDPQNRVIYYNTPTIGNKVLSDKTIDNIKSMLKDVVNYGTGKRAEMPGIAVFGKTGTSQDYRDAWFFGFANGLTTGIWVGNDDNIPMRNLTGGTIPTIIWKHYMLNLVGSNEKSSTIKIDKRRSIFDFFSSKKNNVDTIEQIIQRSKNQ